MTPRIPQAKTLKRYGLTQEEWKEMVERQGNVCAICKKLPTNGRLCTDHEHVKGWAKKPPEQRKLYCRGAVCWFCNHYYLGRSITVKKAEAVVTYLKEYERRRDGN